MIAKLINDDINLLDINQSRVAKTKERLVKTKNKKNIITRTKKTKAKSTRRNLFDFKYVDATIKVSRDSKRAIKRDNNRDKARQEKQKKSKVDIVVAIDANI